MRNLTVADLPVAEGPNAALRLALVRLPSQRLADAMTAARKLTMTKVHHLTRR